MTALPAGQPAEPASKPAKKPGRPKKEPPACEKAELAKYPPEGILVIWGTEPESPGFERKGLALLYNPVHPGGQVTLMPVKDQGDGLRWRYRFIQGYCPYRYEKIDLEPGQAASLPASLRQMADMVEQFVTGQFGGTKEAVQKDEDYHAGLKKDRLSDKIKSMNVF